MQAASSDGVLVERCIDALLSGNIAAEDTARLALQNHLQLMQLIQLSLQYVWGLQVSLSSATVFSALHLIVACIKLRLLPCAGCNNCSCCCN